MDGPPSDEGGAVAAALPGMSTPPAQAAAESNATTTDTTTSDSQTPTEPSATEPTTSQNPTGMVEIGIAQVATAQDENGNSFAVGHVTIVNTSAYEITNFSITMSTGDGTYPLIPFQGTIENPVEITIRRIPAGGYLDVPVMTEGVFQTSVAQSQKTVTVTAMENGLVATDSTTIQ
jgi:hypothetical protein